MVAVLQTWEAPFGPGPANALPVAAWARATTLRHFGVELRVTRGAARAVLHHIGAGGGALAGPEPLVCEHPGSAFTPPLHLPDLGAFLLPAVEPLSDDAEWSLIAFTGDPAGPVPPQPCVIQPAGDPAAARHGVAAFRAAGPVGHLALVATTEAAAAAAAAEAAGDGAVTVLRGAPAGAWGHGAWEAAYGSLLERAGPTHLCFLAPDAHLPAEALRRLAALLRFARPDLHLGGILCTPGEAGVAPGGRVLGAGRRCSGGLIEADAAPGAGLAAADPALLSALAAVDHAADVLCIPRSGLYRIGLPWPAGADPTAGDFALRAAALYGPPAMLPALRAEAAAPPPAPAPDPERLRNRALALRGRGVPAAAILAEQAGLVAARLAAGGEAAAGPLLAAMPEIAAAAAGGPEGALARRLGGPALWAGLAAGGAGHGEGEAAARLDALEREVVRLHYRLAEAEARLRAETAGAAAALRDRLDAAGLGDPGRLRADLDRASRAALSLLRGRHAGQRAVIVGNGPSLRIADLDRLRGTVTFGSNKIFLAYSATAWRPTYYTVEDGLVLRQARAAIGALEGSVKIFPDNMRAEGHHDADTLFVPLLPPRSFETPLDDPDFPAFSTDLSHGVGWGSTVVYSQIQMAVHMGCTDIVLIGLDHSYVLPAARIGNAYVQEDEVNHFHSDYRQPGELWHQPNLEVLEVSYRRARTVCEGLGVRIRNASRETRLEVFDRADFDALFPAGEGGDA